MLRSTLAFLLLVSACSLEPPPDLVVYHAAPQALPGGETRTRSLLITGARQVFALDRSPAGVVVRTGTAGATYEDLRTALSRARYLPKDTAGPELAVPTFQIRAVLGNVTVELTRDPARPVERDVEQVVASLEEIWGTTAPAADVVAALKPLLESPRRDLRGWGAISLLRVWGDERAAAGVHEAVERALRDHLRVEKDRQILHGIRDVIDQPDED